MENSLQPILKKYLDRLWPICRSITGNGLRESLKIISEIVPLELHEVSSGEKILDWTVPDEWNISEAYIITPHGERICDLAVNNLHLVNYSEPVELELTFQELDKHLHSIPELPEAIPYVTSYYKRTWGFCIPHHKRIVLPHDGKYKVVIKSTLQPGALTYGEAVLKGGSGREILFSTYLCHPSLANNELSGPLVQAFLYQRLSTLKERKYTYRFLFVPETIGVIAYLHERGQEMKKVLDAGYVLTCCGDRGKFTYKRSRNGNTMGDRAVERIFKIDHPASDIIPFAVGGSDERQYCSPGFDLPVGSIMRTPYQKYEEYHTSLDDRNFVSVEKMEETIELCVSVVHALERNIVPVSTVQEGEPQLGKRGLYPSSVDPLAARDFLHDRMHLLNYADGKHELSEIARLRNVTEEHLLPHLEELKAAGLIVLR